MMTPSSGERHHRKQQKQLILIRVHFGKHQEKPVQLTDWIHAVDMIHKVPLPQINSHLKPENRNVSDVAVDQSTCLWSPKVSSGFGGIWWL